MATIQRSAPARKAVSRTLISPFPCDPVVASTQEAADRQYRFIVCTFK